MVHGNERVGAAVHDQGRLAAQARVELHLGDALPDPGRVGRFFGIERAAPDNVLVDGDIALAHGAVEG